jgi:hypothetical protein
VAPARHQEHIVTNVYVIETLARQQMIRNAEAARRHADRYVPAQKRARRRLPRLTGHFRSRPRLA